MFRKNFEFRRKLPLINGLLAVMMMLGTFSAAYAQEGNTQVLLPLFQAGTSTAQTVNGPFTDVPDATELEAAGRDLGCYSKEFLLEKVGSGTIYKWNGNVQLGRGSRTEPVRNVQQFLVYSFGKDLGSYGFRRDGVDGAFGYLTYKAVKEVQRSYRNAGFTACGRPISADGVVGPQTWAIFFNR